MKKARDYIDSALHDCFRAVALPKPEDGLCYLDANTEIELGAFGALNAIRLLLAKNRVSQYGTQMLQDIVLLAIGIKHRLQDTSEKDRFQLDIKELCMYDGFRDLYLELDVECPAYRKDSVLYVKRNEVVVNCRCPDHPAIRPNVGGPFDKIKRLDIRHDSGNYVLLNPFDGGRSIYCWDCAGRRGYPWRPFQRLSEM